MRVANPSGGLPSTTVTLTAAQIRALGSTPIPLVPAPGAGRVIAVVGVAFVYLYGTHTYFDPQNGTNVAYASNLNYPLLGTSSDINVVTQPNSSFNYSPGVISTQLNLLPGVDNQAVMLTGDNLVNGPIVTATLGAAGTGYAVNDTGTITTNSGDATYQITSVGALGAVTGFTITAPGTEYAVANGVATATGGAQPGAGAGFTVNITAVTLGDGTLKVVTYYQIVPVP
jgi:hypothetical protein